MNNLTITIYKYIFIKYISPFSEYSTEKHLKNAKGSPLVDGADPFDEKINPSPLNE